MTSRRALALAALTCAALALSSAAQAGSVAGSSGASRFCDRGQPLTAAEQDRLLRFAAVLREELADVDDGVALVSRSGLDLSRFDIRYSHAALAWRSDSGAWSARQLYYACDESRPRIFDQGLAGFALGTDDPAMGYVSVVRLPAEAIAALRPALLDGPRVQHLLASQYSASAYAFSVRYQNCNQWVMEMLAAGWGDLPDGDDLRARAQAWLRDAHYAPQPVQIGSRWLMLASHFVPLLHLDDHPDEDRAAMQLRISLPSTVEAFVHQRYPASTRVEMCHDDERIVIHRGWTPIAAGCKPGEGDRVVSLRD
ncbi:hypothetical protein Jab_1c11560 [Janthinobacterium sp. HH01]|uniref:DUF2145 domain-containing protein n=1 Tax=Janthinobacterium sp. HH01 TaxID=1198452 RepID=UPI0002AE8BF7|nr:DUF2145 domain-containing protein [Janthinobacterium sp. HH01]ELX12542.1 hypothetical protein Jab_1c11560 [Janthinobacterium sp. HH01]